MIEVEARPTSVVGKPIGPGPPATRCCADSLLHIGFPSEARRNSRETATMDNSRLTIMRDTSHKPKIRGNYPRLSYGALTDILPVFADPKRRARFEAKVDRSAGPRACHPWHGGGRLAQGCIAYQSYSFLAHRVAWALANGREPGQTPIRHTCRSHGVACCNPAHMVLQGNVEPTTTAAKRGAEANAADFDQDARDRARRLRYEDRLPFAEIARLIGCSRSTIARWFSDPG